MRRSRELVLKTTFALLVEKGMSHASVDEVAKRSGVAKTTIYRHWRTRADLVFEACSLVSGRLETPDTGSFEGDVTALLTALARQLTTAAWPHVFPSMVDAGERDAEMAAAFAERQRMHAAPHFAAITRAKERGEIAASVDAANLVARMIGPLFYRRWFTREALDRAFIKGVVEAALAGL